MENKVTAETIKVFKCLNTDCDFSTPSSSTFLDHFISHLNRKIEFNFYDTEESKKCHIVENKYMCSICYDIFNSKNALKMHYIRTHGYKEKLETNPTDESLSQPEPEAERDVEHEPEPSTSSSHNPDDDNCCSIIHPKIEVSDNSKKSKKSGKQTDAKQRWYTVKTCEICKQTFKNSKTLSKHIKVVHHKIKSFICNVCGYKAARKATLIIHQRQHSGAKPLSCRYCPAKSSDPSALAKHEKLHINTTEGRYKCKYCEFYTIQTTGLKNHILFKHPEKYCEIKCDQCDYVSVNAQFLKNHMNNHKIGLIRKDTEEADDKSRNINNTVELSSDCFLPIESTDSIVHNPNDTGGVTIIHSNNSATIPPHSEDTQF